MGKSSKVPKERRDDKPEQLPILLRRGQGKGPVLLHAGGDEGLYLDEIVAILRKSTVDASQANRDMLEVASSENRLVDLSEGQAESVIFTKDTVVLSPVTPPTLKRRVEGD